MKRMGFRVAAVVTLVLAGPAMATGPGFDCTKAKTADERAVCRSATLGRLDRKLQAMYREVQACSLMGGRAANRDDEVEWLAKRKRCGAGGTCIRALYDKRLAALKPDVARVRAERKAGQCPDQ